VEQLAPGVHGIRDGDEVLIELVRGDGSSS
jgi:hypothetical protein